MLVSYTLDFTQLESSLLDRKPLAQREIFEDFVSSYQDDATLLYPEEGLEEFTEKIQSQIPSKYRKLILEF